MTKSLLFVFCCLVYLATEAQDETLHYSYKAREIGKVNEKGLKSGEWKIYDSNNKLSVIETFENGNWVGIRQVFYKDSLVRTEEVIHRKKHTFLLVKEYYENGELRTTGYQKWATHRSPSCAKEESTGIYVNTGNWRTYYENGKLKDVGEYITGERSGKWKSYHENGHLAEKGKYNKYGSCVGKWKFYDLHGKLIESYRYDGN